MVTELAANATQHGLTGELTVLVEPRGWRVLVCDRGAGLPPEVLEQREAGTGLSTVRRLCTSLSMHNDGLGACVVATRVFPPDYATLA